MQLLAAHEGQPKRVEHTLVQLRMVDYILVRRTMLIIDNIFIFNHFRF